MMPFRSTALALWLLCCYAVPALAQQEGIAGEIERERQQQQLRILQTTQAIDSGGLPPRQLAEVLRMRGITYSNLSQPDRAVQDFTRAIQIEPRNGVTYVDRGVAFHALKDYDRALTDFAEGIALQADFALGYISRGHLYYYRDRLEEAAQDFADGVSVATGEDFLYGALWHYLTLQRLGRDGKKALAELTKERDLTAWPGPIVKLYLGESSADHALAQATGGEKQSARMQQCEAQFYVAQHYLLAGDSERAASAFRKAVDTQVTMYIEYQFAQVELDRMKAGVKQ